MFGLRRKPTLATAAATAQNIALMREVAAEVKARRHDAREVALGVLALIRHEALDLYYTTSEIDDWIREWARIGGVDVTDLDFGIVRQQIKAQPGVRFYETRVKKDPAYRTIRTRLERKRGHIPEKVWVYYVAASEMAVLDTVADGPESRSAAASPPRVHRLVAGAPTDEHRSRRRAAGPPSGEDMGVHEDRGWDAGRSRPRSAA